MPEPPEDSLFSSQAYSLSALNAAIRETLELTFPDTFWVVAEISEARCNAKGHCYLELVEKRDDSVIAQMKATIWAYTYRTLSHNFEKATGESLKKGMQVLLSAEVNFHEVYGLSLNVKDIDPTYSLGEMARKKRETVERLYREGLTELNKALPLPLVPQRIAVISSESAAGYGDFVEHIENNPYRYKIRHKLYQSLMQGEGAEASVIAALVRIKARISLYDLVVIIRGGGSQTDLSCFDSYGLAAEVAKCPLPVITGIGHERDDTVVDIVAHTRMKTPTAAAGFIIDGIRTFEDHLLDIERRLFQTAREQLKDEHHRFKGIVQGFAHMIAGRFHLEDRRLHTNVHRLVSGTNQAISAGAGSLRVETNKLRSSVRSLFKTQNEKVKHLEHGVRLLDPTNVLRRGYSITYFNDKAVRSVSELSKGDNIRTRVFEGSIESKVEGLNEEG
jgi:exodeoxyribonuclease VII large subunit